MDKLDVETLPVSYVNYTVSYEGKILINAVSEWCSLGSYSSMTQQVYSLQHSAKISCKCQ